jgi:hypothetical protein
MGESRIRRGLTPAFDGPILKVIVPRIAAVLVLVGGLLGIVTLPASADPTSTQAAALGALYTKVLETPSAQNPFGSGGTSASPCWDLDGTVAPLAPKPVKLCTVNAGTKILVAASTAECSTFPNDCAAVAPPESELALLARPQVDATAPSVTVNGKDVQVTFVQSEPMTVNLPADNIFGVSGGGVGTSVALGWVALLGPLSPGNYAIHVRTAKLNYVTRIVVQANQ